MGSEWEVYTISPESVGLSPIAYETLRALMEGTALENFPDDWRVDAIEDLLEAALVEPEFHGPSLNSARGPRGTQSQQGTVEELPERPGYMVTLEGHTLLAQCGTFRRRLATTVSSPEPTTWRKSIAIAAAFGAVVGFAIAVLAAWLAS